MPEQNRTEPSKFSGALAKLKQPPVQLDPTSEQIVTNTSSIAEPTARGKGRPTGKRSNPDYQPTTILLRKQTKKKANRLLEDAEAGQDLSDLVEQLLAEWIQRQA